MQICRLDAQGSRCGYLDFQRKSWREFLSISGGFSEHSRYRSFLYAAFFIKRGLFRI